MSPSLPFAGTAASRPAADRERQNAPGRLQALMALAGMLLKPRTRQDRGLLRNSLPISAKAFISTALPLGSLKNMVACSPGSPLKRM